MKMTENIETSKQHFDSAMSLIMVLNINDNFKVRIQQMKEGFESFYLQHEIILARYQVLAINLHLTGFRAGFHELNPKLSPIINRLRKSIKEERDEYF